MMTKRIGILAIIAVTCFAIGYGIGYLTTCIMGPERKISIFLDSIDAIAKERNISFAQAAEMVHDLGYGGVDVFVGTDKEKLRIADSIGFAHPCAIAIIDFCNGGECNEEIENAFRFMQENAFQKVLLVPGCFSEPPTMVQKDAVIAKVRSFSYKAKKMGMTVLIEDFDDICSPCMTSDDLDHFFAACPDLGHVFDSGNYPFCGEDEVEALKHFLPRTKHIHFKDRSERGAKDLPAIGTGIVRFEEILEILDSAEYDGWITVEIAGKDLYKASEISINNIKR